MVLIDSRGRLGGGFSAGKQSRREWAGSTEMTVYVDSGCLRASCRASEADVVVFPTPPLPATNVRRATSRVTGCGDRPKELVPGSGSLSLPSDQAAIRLGVSRG